MGPDDTSSRKISIIAGPMSDVAPLSYAPSDLGPGVRNHVTLILCTILHAFTHAYGTMLVPLYLLMVADLRLGGVKAASLIVTLYGLFYCIGSYGAGVLADRFDRRALLGIGLIGNALAITAMGPPRHPQRLIPLAILAVLFDTMFHPAANALVPAHYPRSPGMAIGLLGIGAGLGFFAGPQYAGWRAQAAGWQWGAMASWQKPCVEAGIAGAVFGLLFLLVARETRSSRGGGRHSRPPLDRRLRNRTIALGAVLGWRDFAGVASPTLLSIYLQKAHAYDAKHAGLVV